MTRLENTTSLAANAHALKLTPQLNRSAIPAGIESKPAGVAFRMNEPGLIDRSSYALSTAIFNLEHREETAPSALAKVSDSYFVDPLVEATCPCILEDIKVIAWSLRPLKREAGKSIGAVRRPVPVDQQRWNDDDR